MNKYVIEIGIGAVLIGIALIVGFVVMQDRSKQAMQGRQGTERLTAEQVVDLEVAADAQNTR